MIVISSNFLVNLAEAMGIELQLINADEAYHDKDGSLFEKTGANRDNATVIKGVVTGKHRCQHQRSFCNDECSTPMRHIGIEDQKHEYKCSAASGQCQFSDTCCQYRFRPLDWRFISTNTSLYRKHTTGS